MFVYTRQHFEYKRKNQIPVVSCKAIVIDDDIDTVEIYAEFLKDRGIHVLGAGHNGNEAVRLYKKFKPDVVLLDVMMPEYDGFYALENIRKIDPNSRIIMSTADKTLETRKRLEDGKVNAIVYKPYEIKNVLSAIDEVMAENKAYAEL